MRLVSISEAKDHLPELVRQAAKEIIVLTRSGHICARLESFDEEDLEEDALYTNRNFIRWLENAYQSSFRGSRLKVRSTLENLRSKHKS